MCVKSVTVFFFLELLFLLWSAMVVDRLLLENGNWFQTSLRPPSLLIQGFISYVPSPASSVEINSARFRVLFLQ